MLRRILAYYTIENKSSKTCEYQPGKSDDNLIEYNHEEHSYTPQIKLMISEETMQCHKVRRLFRYHVSNKFSSPEKFAYHALLLFYSFRDEKELLSGFPPLYQNQLQEQEAHEVENINKIKFELHGNLVDQAYSKF